MGGDSPEQQSPRRGSKLPGDLLGGDSPEQQSPLWSNSASGNLLGGDSPEQQSSQRCCAGASQRRGAWDSPEPCRGRLWPPSFLGDLLGGDSPEQQSPHRKLRWGPLRRGAWDSPEPCQRGLRRRWGPLRRSAWDSPELCQRGPWSRKGGGGDRPESRYQGQRGRHQAAVSVAVVAAQHLRAYRQLRRHSVLQGESPTSH